MEKKKLLEGYYSKLKEALESSKASFIFNKDRSHNATIMRFMFDSSHNVVMYCGSMSVFRNGFYEKIENEGENEAEQKIKAEEAKDELKSSLKSFFAKEDSSLSVIMENYEDVFLSDLIDENLFKENAAKGRLKLYKLSDNFTFKKKLSHFSSCDLKLVRLEQDKEEHSAVCIINDEKLSDSSKIMFNKLVSVAVPVSFTK